MPHEKNVIGVLACISIQFISLEKEIRYYDFMRIRMGKNLEARERGYVGVEIYSVILKTKKFQN